MTLPDLRNVGLVAIDTEGRDGGLQAKRGSAWPWGDGHVSGISLAWREGGDTCQREVGYTEFFAGEPVPMRVVAGDDCGDPDEIPESEADAAIGFQEQRRERRELRGLWQTNAWVRQ